MTIPGISAVVEQVLGAKAPKKQRTVADDAAEILEASHYQELVSCLQCFFFTTGYYWCRISYIYIVYKYIYTYMVISTYTHKCVPASTHAHIQILAHTLTKPLRCA